VLPGGEVVVKPAVGAGSRDAASYGPEQGDAALAHVRRLLAQDRSVLVQPLLASVAVDGEWPLVFFGGRYSHAASKRVTLPRAGVIDGLFAPETLAEHQADAAQLEVARAAMGVVERRFGTPDYARIDLVGDDEGRPVVLEVELVEPSLFLAQAGPRAVDLLVDSVTTDA
jgi:glutathione synthase/RimK-type ligase-like ATP-grasp enzyme